MCARLEGAGKEMLSNTSPDYVSFSRLVEWPVGFDDGSELNGPLGDISLASLSKRELMASQQGNSV